MDDQVRQGFWQEAISLQGSITLTVAPLVLTFGLLASFICCLVLMVERWFDVRLALELTPHELAGAALGLLLVLRTNSGYDRWWEARKLWGGFVDRCRSFAINVLAYGPRDSAWRDKVIRWAASYPHIARHSLRKEPPGDEVVQLLGKDQTERLAGAEQMPMLVALTLADFLREACDQFGMDRFSFLRIDRERGLLIDNYGGCERILNTPLPKVYSLKIRHFILLFLITLPFALLHRLGSDWLVPFVTMLAAYPLISLDQIGIELENPFTKENISHLPLEGISATIERNLLELLRQNKPN